jgi:hypothetical protein
MKRYPDDESKIVDSLFTKYVIVVATEQDKVDLMEAFKLIHDSRDIDNSFVPVNQLMHEYQPSNDIVVSKDAYEVLLTMKET